MKIIDQPKFQYLNLGPTDIQISPLGIGTWSWGDRFFWGYGDQYDISDLEDVFHLIIESNINLIDTAEVYGMGKSEEILGRFKRKIKKPLVIATKFFPYPWRISDRSAKNAIQNSMSRLDVERVDLYQFHMPFPPFSIEFWLQKLANLYHAGYVRAIGVSNFDLQKTKRAHKFLVDQGVPLASNQLRFSLLDRDAERSGLLDYCKENDISVLAYSPLAMGMLTGKYSAATPPRGIRRTAYRYSPQYLESIRSILDLMSEIGRAHGGKTLAQVALNWTLRKGSIPIPGAKNRTQILDNLGALGWKLTSTDVDALDKITEKY